MKITDVVAETNLNMEESKKQRDQRIEELWRKLDPDHHGELDIKGLQKGLKRIDHRKKPTIPFLSQLDNKRTLD